MTSEPPTLPTRLTVIELTENNAPRSCKVCSGDADYYVFVTDESARERLGPDADVSHDDWPVNAMLCGQHFREAPRVSNLRDHPRVA